MKQQLVPTPIKVMGRVITGRTPSTKNLEYYGDDYFFISPADLGGKKYVSDSIKKLSDLGIKKANKLPAQTILFTCIGSTIGKIGMSENECATNQQINAVVVDKNNFDPNYVYYQLAKHSLRIAELAGRQAVPIVNKSTFESYEINTHPLDDQKKIAQILSTWDEAIEAVEELIEKKKDQKKILSEELFSGSRRLAEGSTKIQETKYGDIPADWDFLPISKVAKINKKSLGNNTLYKSYKYIDLSSVSEGVISFPEEEITYEELPSRARRIILKGDVIFSTVRPNLLGYAIVDFDTSNHLCSTGFAVITPNVESDTNFIYQQLYSNLFQRQVFSKVTGSNYPAINSTDFNNIKLNWPTDKNERKEIGDLLTSIELEVQLLYNKRKLLEKQKKALMQQLLTGKTRIG